LGSSAFSSGISCTPVDFVGLVPAAAFARVIAAFLPFLPAPTVFLVHRCCDDLSCCEAMSEYLAKLDALALP
jgi:hypothetical protein